MYSLCCALVLLGVIIASAAYGRRFGKYYASNVFAELAMLCGVAVTVYRFQLPRHEIRAFELYFLGALCCSGGDAP